MICISNGPNKEGAFGKGFKSPSKKNVTDGRLCSLELPF